MRLLPNFPGRAGSFLGFCLAFFAMAQLASFTTAINCVRGGPIQAEALLEFTVSPVATGKQLIRTSLPFSMNHLTDGQEVVADDESQRMLVAVRPVTWHPGEAKPRSIRRAIVTFPYHFKSLDLVKFTLHPATTEEIAAQDDSEFPVTVRKQNRGWTLRFAAGHTIELQPVWPEDGSGAQWQQETIEKNDHFHWKRWVQQDELWARRVEFRLDSTGQVVAVAHLQRRQADGNWSPQFGWDMKGPFLPQPSGLPEKKLSKAVEPDQTFKQQHSFASGKPYVQPLDPIEYQVVHPAATLKRCGTISLGHENQGEQIYRYLRCDTDDRVAMQPFAWRRAEIVLQPESIVLPTATLASPHRVNVDWQSWNTLYDIGQPVDTRKHIELGKLLAYHHQAIIASAAVGHDWGNVTRFEAEREHGIIYGMNRINHCPEIFFEAMRSGDRQLTETALAWCDNFFDLTIWWGPEKPGGTRYPRVTSINRPIPDDGTTFMWRGNQSNHFCTKGFDSFLLAYEQTGDPRMKEALDAQVAYAIQHVHSVNESDIPNSSACRNIGVVADFVRLYELSGNQKYLDNALRLFRELRTVLMPTYLFSQNGGPILPDVRFIDEDDLGLKLPFAKPYILGYGLAGCPQLVRYAPKEPKLNEMIEAVADFLTANQDSLGGWRYPHPSSSKVITCQAIEHAEQLVQACKTVGNKQTYLDSIERVLRQRLWIWKKSGTILNTVGGWELGTGRIKTKEEIYKLYKQPGDRDPSQDYRHGKLSLGVSSPEGLVYFPIVLQYYLQQRPVSRLTAPPPIGTPLEQLLSRIDPDQ